jgi:hypothetical protein
MGRLLDVASTLLCIGAGLYLLQYNAPTTPGTTGTSWFQIIGHGMGIYFIGKGLLIARSLHLQAEANDKLETIAAWSAYQNEQSQEDAEPQ